MAVDRERIGAGFFGEAFKNTLRDYYAYGFYTARDLPDSMNTTANNWNRLNNILHDRNFWFWADSPRGRLFVTADSRRAHMNLFQLVYQYCGFKPEHVPKFFATVMLLSPRVSMPRLDDEMEKLPDSMDSDEFERRLSDDSTRRLYGSELFVLTDKERSHPSESDMRSFNRFLVTLSENGILKESGSGNKKIWSISNCFLGEVIKAGSLAADGDDEATGDGRDSFKQRFDAAMYFFAQYMTPGVPGFQIMSRMGACDSRRNNYIRFRHEYFVSALNDYLTVDIMDAMEKGDYLVLNYSNPSRNITGEVICIPLELRISNANGRSYLAYYDPIDRRLGCVRLEMIDRMEIFKGLRGENKPEKCLKDKASFIDEDIRRCREMLKTCWGVSMLQGDGGRGNVEEETGTRHVRLEWSTKGYDGRRLVYRVNRERRFGMVTEDKERKRIVWEADVLEPGELRPWVRSLYGSMVSASGMEEFGILTSDIKQMRSAEGDNDRYFDVPYNKAGIKAYQRRLPDGRIGEGIAGDDSNVKSVPYTAHSALFNEYSGIYFKIIGEWLSLIFSMSDVWSGRVALTEKKVFSKVKAAEIMRWLDDHPEAETWIVLDDLYLNNELISDHQIMPDPANGLTDDDIRRAERIINGIHY